MVADQATDCEIFSLEQARGTGSQRAFLLRQGDLVKFRPSQVGRAKMSRSVLVLEIISTGAGASIQTSGELAVPDLGFRQEVRWTRILPVKRIFWLETKKTRRCWSCSLRALDFGSWSGRVFDCRRGVNDRPQWRNFLGDVGEEISFGELRAGVWTYLVQGGFAASRWFGSASVDPRAGFGTPLSTGTPLRRLEKKDRPVVLSRFVPELVRERFDPMPVFESGRDRNGNFSRRRSARFLNEPWVVSTQSDRAGIACKGLRWQSNK